MSYAAAILLFALFNRLRGWNPVDDWVRVNFSGADYEEKPELAKNCPQWRNSALWICGDLPFAIFSAVAAAFMVGWDDYRQLGYIMLTVFIGVQIWARPRWSPGFAAFTGKYNYKKYGVCEWIVAKCLSENASGYTKGTLYMAARGMYAAPMFTALALITGNYWKAALVIPFAIGMAFSYGVMRVVPEEKQLGIPCGEALTGAFLGACLWLVFGYVGA